MRGEARGAAADERHAGGRVWGVGARLPARELRAGRRGEGGAARRPPPRPPPPGWPQRGPACPACHPAAHPAAAPPYGSPHRSELRHQVGEVAASAVACGVMGVGGNKGAVALSFSLMRRRIVVVASHFAAHQVRRWRPGCLRGDSSHTHCRQTTKEDSSILFRPVPVRSGVLQSLRRAFCTSDARTRASLAPRVTRPRRKRSSRATPTTRKSCASCASRTRPCRRTQAAATTAAAAAATVRRGAARGGARGGRGGRRVLRDDLRRIWVPHVAGATCEWSNALLARAVRAAAPLPPAAPHRVKQPRPASPPRADGGGGDDSWGSGMRDADLLIWVRGRDLAHPERSGGAQAGAAGGWSGSSERGPSRHQLQQLQPQPIAASSLGCIPAILDVRC